MTAHRHTSRMTVPIDVAVTQRTPGDVWRDKDMLVERERAAVELWSRLGATERAAMASYVQEILWGLLQRVDAWLPTSVTNDGTADRLDVMISIPRAYWEDLQTQQAAAAAHYRAYRVTELQALDAELAEDVDE